MNSKKQVEVTVNGDPGCWPNEDERERWAEEECQAVEAQRQKEAAAVEEFLAACANRMGRMSPALAELESSSSSDDEEDS